MRIDQSSPDSVEHYARLAESVAETGYISCEPSFERGYRQAARDAAEKIRASQPATPTGGEAVETGPVTVNEWEDAQSSAGSAPDREAVAKIIYDAFPFTPYLGCAHKPEWVTGGNSFNQDEARRAADRILAISSTEDK